ncbi:MAG TPA: type II toxin-antitoxin system HicA family toxin [Thermoanaerobaculia bacterium]|nr:type II toxin-antitoxin system HicA family toxin [Thermoanaerobaculia bacterium]
MFHLRRQRPFFTDSYEDSETSVSGSHHMFKHAPKPGTVVVPHPKKDLGKGLANAIRKQADLK